MSTADELRACQGAAESEIAKAMQSLTRLWMHEVGRLAYRLVWTEACRAAWRAQDRVFLRHYCLIDTEDLATAQENGRPYHSWL